MNTLESQAQIRMSQAQAQASDSEKGKKKKRVAKTVARKNVCMASKVHVTPA